MTTVSKYSLITVLNSNECNESNQYAIIINNNHLIKFQLQVSNLSYQLIDCYSQSSQSMNCLFSVFHQTLNVLVLGNLYH